MASRAPRRWAADLLAFLLVGFVCLVVFAKFPDESGILKGLTSAVAFLEGQSGTRLTPIAIIDFVMVLAVLAFTLGSLALNSLARILAMFFSFSVSVLLRKSFNAAEIVEDPPPWRWMLIPFAVLALSIGCVRIYPEQAEPACAVGAESSSTATPTVPTDRCDRARPAS